MSGVLGTHSMNMKTGPMAQLWIMRADISPVEAIYSGQDVSICGNCPLKGENGRKRTCYVNVSRAPLQTWSGKKQGKLPNHALRGRSLRLGAYGDPAALPFEVVEKLVRQAINHTGYTHLWRTCDDRFKAILVASCDSENDRIEAKSMGWTTFRIKTPDEPYLLKEDPCPASEEAGKIMQCINCTRCSGEQKRDIAINVHGRNQKQFALKAAQEAI